MTLSSTLAISHTNVWTLRWNVRYRFNILLSGFLYLSYDIINLINEWINPGMTIGGWIIVDILSTEREGLMEATSKSPLTIVCMLDKGNLVLICRLKKVVQLLEYLEGNLSYLTSLHIAQFKTFRCWGELSGLQNCQGTKWLNQPSSFLSTVNLSLLLPNHSSDGPWLNRTFHREHGKRPPLLPGVESHRLNHALFSPSPSIGRNLKAILNIISLSLHFWTRSWLPLIYKGHCWELSQFLWSHAELSALS